MCEFRHSGNFRVESFGFCAPLRALRLLARSSALGRVFLSVNSEVGQPNASATKVRSQEDAEEPENGTEKPASGEGVGLTVVGSDFSERERRL